LCTRNGLSRGNKHSYTIFVNRYEYDGTAKLVPPPPVCVLYSPTNIALSAPVDQLAGRLPCRAATQCLFCTGPSLESTYEYFPERQLPSHDKNMSGGPDRLKYPSGKPRTTYTLYAHTVRTLSYYYIILCATNNIICTYVSFRCAAREFSMPRVSVCVCVRACIA
jgi:hypothetical protein